MAGSTFGTIFRITTWGESHGKGIGVVVDGCPAGIPLTEADIQPYNDRRRPNAGKMSTKRKEPDTVEILSGTFEGKTTGTPISILIRNTDQHSGDYSNIMDIYRPGHADFGFDKKYGFRDYRGGGRSSGRETAGRVAGGAVAMQLLKQIGITFQTEVLIGGIPADEALELLDACRAKGDSIGSTVKCTVSGVPAGLGDPVFEKLDANLAKAIFSIGAVKAFEIGDGCAVSSARGSENNDAFTPGEHGPKTVTNHAGGVLGGFSSGSDLILTAHFKPTPSISQPQQTVNRKGSAEEIVIKGRHDPVIGPRAAVVVECMAALVIADALLLNMTANMDGIRKFYLS